MPTLDDLLQTFNSEHGPEPTEKPLIEPIDYGNGVLYFDCIREQFAKSLSAWLGKHKNAVAVGLAPNLSNEGGGQSAYCEVRGYIVLVYYTKNK